MEEHYKRKYLKYKAKVQNIVAKSGGALDDKIVISPENLSEVQSEVKPVLETENPFTKSEIKPKTYSPVESENISELISEHIKQISMHAEKAQSIINNRFKSESMPPTMQQLNNSMPPKMQLDDAMTDLTATDVLEISSPTAIIEQTLKSI